MSSLVPRIIGTGRAVPEEIRLNDDAIFDWLKDHPTPGQDLFAGYEKRHVLSDGETMIDIMMSAAQSALKNAGIRANQVDLLLGDGSMGEYRTPNTISELHQLLGLPSRALSLPLQNNFSQFNTSVMIADALIRVGRAKYVLIVLGENWTNFVDYKTPQSISAADGAAACVIGPSPESKNWEFVDQITVSDTSYYGSMFMASGATRKGSKLDEYSRDYFHITEKGIEGFTKFGVKKSPDAVIELLARNQIDARDVCLLTHQASTRLMEHWQDVIKPGCYVQTIKQYANMVQCSVLFNLSWGMQNVPGFTQNWLVVLSLGPDMHANAMLMRRNS